MACPRNPLAGADFLAAGMYAENIARAAHLSAGMEGRRDGIGSIDAQRRNIERGVSKLAELLGYDLVQRPQPAPTLQPVGTMTAYSGEVAQ